ncbi:MAG TPA: cytochrome o ubiquinol oxidase subunit IV [Candidatus Paceibacterota bacterium]|nr:cytochrome o ubiquinol oxidase subunit IV [Candidatus Paceibacterota bacterium]
MNTRDYFEEIGIWPHGKQKVVRSYIIGFILSLVLTFVAYYLATTGQLPYQSALICLILLALVQFIVQIVCFLHLDTASVSRERLFILAGACTVILILVSGSLWIMFTLNGRMMPSPEQMEEYMSNQEGI